MGWRRKEIREELDKLVEVKIEANRYHSRAIDAENNYAVVNDMYKDLKGVNKALSKENEAFKGELEIMYLRAIGNATTVKEVARIMERYRHIMIANCGEELSGGMVQAFKNLKYVIIGGPAKESLSKAEQAAKTKIKRLHRDEVKLTLSLLEDGAVGQVPDTMYVGVMTKLVENITNAKIDGVKVLEAKNAGLNPEQVLDSILVQYGIDKDSVM